MSPGIESADDTGDLCQIMDQNIRRQAGAGKGGVPVGD